MTYLPPGVQAPLFLLVLVAAAGDLKSRRIPNWLTGGAFCAAVLLHLALSGVPGGLFALKGAGLALLVYIPLFLLRAVGGGDVKLMAAAGALAGAENWLVIFFLAAIAGGLLGLALIIWRGTVRRTLGNIGFILARLVTFRAPFRGRPELDAAHERALTLPHAVAIAAGTLLYLLAAWIAAPRT